MKKIFNYGILFLLSLALVGCGQDRYSIEREHWKIQREAKKIFKNPHASPPNELERVVNLLDGFAKKHPNISLSLDAEFTISRLYMAKKEYKKARQQLGMIIEKYSKIDDICAESMFLIGNSYEMEDKWSSALAEYKKIMEKYPLSQRGFSVPVYIAVHYQVQYEPDKMVAAYREAINHYASLIAKHPGTPIEYNANTLIANSYIAIKDWQNALVEIDKIIANFKGRVNVEWFVLEKAGIYYKELRDYAKAKETLEHFISEYPGSSLIKTAKKLLKELGKKDEAGNK